MVAWARAGPRHPGSEWRKKEGRVERGTAQDKAEESCQSGAREGMATEAERKSEEKEAMSEFQLTFLRTVSRSGGQSQPAGGDGVRPPWGRRPRAPTPPACEGQDGEEGSSQGAGGAAEKELVELEAGGG